MQRGGGEFIGREWRTPIPMGLQRLEVFILVWDSLALIPAFNFCRASITCLLASLVSCDLVAIVRYYWMKPPRTRPRI
jgi:hypothetical protein